MKDSKKLYKAHSSSYFINQCDWDFTEESYDLDEAVGAVVTRLIQWGLNPHNPEEIQVSYQNVLEHEVFGECVSIKEHPLPSVVFSEHPLVAAHKEEKQREAEETEKKYQEQAKQERLRIYEEVKRELEHD